MGRAQSKSSEGVSVFSDDHRWLQIQFINSFIPLFMYSVRVSWGIRANILQTNFVELVYRYHRKFKNVTSAQGLFSQP